MRSRHFWAVDWRFINQSASRAVYITRGKADARVREMRKTQAPENFSVEPHVVQTTKQDYLDQLNNNPER